MMWLSLSILRILGYVNKPLTAKGVRSYKVIGVQATLILYLVLQLMFLTHHVFTNPDDPILHS
jgi:hypothetical protein